MYVDYRCDVCDYSTGCACAVAVTGLIAGAGPVAAGPVPGAEAGATETGAGYQYSNRQQRGDVLAGSALAPLVGEAPLSRIRNLVPYTANFVEYSHR